MATLLRLVSSVADDLTRQSGQEAARQELSKPDYHHGDPSVPERLLRWVSERLWHLFDSGARGTPGGWLGLVVIIALIVALVVAVRLRIGPLGRTSRHTDAPFLGPTALTARQHRALAEAAADAARWDEAVRERLRAIVRDLEDQGVLDPRPSRTADEAAADAREALGPAGPLLHGAARAFDEIWYGGRPATADDDRLLRETDAAVTTSRRHAPAGVR